MKIRKAEYNDINGIMNLLKQVAQVHHNGRPDIFKENAYKYNEDELKIIIDDENKPIFVCVNEKNEVCGYAFCIFQQHINNNVLTDIKTLYIDDLCIDENLRGQSIGTYIYEFVVDFAKKQGCYNLTLNVWSCNKSAINFYEKCGLVPQKIGMETVL